MIVFLCAVELWVTEYGGVSLEWRVLVRIRVCSWMCTFAAAFVELCVGAQLLVGTGAGSVSCVSGRA